MTYRITAHPRVARWVVRHVAAAMRALARVVEIRRGPRLRVRIVPAPVLSLGRDEAAGFGFGVFSAASRGRPEIHIAGDLRPIARDHHLSPSEIRAFLTDTLAHELVHYQQWRDGRELSERGVAVRARGLVKRMKAEG